MARSDWKNSREYTLWLFNVCRAFWCIIANISTLDQILKFSSHHHETSLKRHLLYYNFNPSIFFLSLSPHPLLDIFKGNVNENTLITEFYFKSGLGEAPKKQTILKMAEYFVSHLGFTNWNNLLMKSILTRRTSTHRRQDIKFT